MFVHSRIIRALLVWNMLLSYSTVTLFLKKDSFAACRDASPGDSVGLINECCRYIVYALHIHLNIHDDRLRVGFESRRKLWNTGRLVIGPTTDSNPQHVLHEHSCYKYVWQNNRHGESDPISCSRSTRQSQWCRWSVGVEDFGI